jgi:hypothetical protein
MKKEIIQFIKEHFYQVNNVPENEILFIEKKIDDYFQNNIIDEELLIYESLILLNYPVSDYVKSLNLLSKFKSPKTLLLKAIIQSINMGFLDENLVSDLMELFEKSDIHKSIIYYLLAKNIQIRNKKEYEQYLKKSIDFNNQTVLSFLELGKYYLEVNKKEEARKYLVIGIQNIKVVLKETDKIDYCDYDFFLNETVIGSYISFVNFEYWNFLLNEL